MVFYALNPTKIFPNSIIPNLRKSQPETPNFSIGHPESFSINMNRKTQDEERKENMIAKAIYKEREGK